MKYKLQDLIDFSSIKDLFMKLYETTDIPLTIVDNEGKTILYTYQQDICGLFHKAYPESRKDCLKSDSFVAEQFKVSKETLIFTCPRGLVDCAIPIVIEGNHLANLFLGQLFIGEPNVEVFKAQAKQFGYNEKDYLKAFKKVPVFTREEVEKKLEFIKVFVNFIADLGVKRLHEIELSKKIKHVEKEISKREQYKLITENSLDIITLSDKDNKIIYVSPACKKVLGYTQGELIGLNISDIFLAEDLKLVDELMTKIKTQKGERYSIIFRLLKKDKQHCWVESVMLPTYDKETGKLVEIQASTRDITKMKMMNEELIAAKNLADQANKAKSEFLANMSHEIRTPLNAVIGFSELLVATKLDEKQKTYVDSIKSSGKGLLTIINDILDLSKIESGRMEIVLEPVNIKDIFLEIERIFAQKIRSKNLKFILDIDSHLPEVLLVDETRVRQVLLNIVGNAVKFTDNGNITLKLEKSYSDIRDASKVNLKISISDTGIGIPEAEYNKIFESFKQQSGQSNRKYGGTGLGLSITKRLVEMMNGKIYVSSVVGSGSTFTIELFNIDVAISKRIPLNNKKYSNIQFEKATVLIVDDVDSNRILIKEILSRRDLNVVSAENGYEAVLTTDEIMPDLVLMDIRMPVMDGFEAYEKIKQNSKTKHIPVIALTASIYNEQQMEDKETRFDGFLTKPVETDKLFGELKKYLKVKSQSEDTSKEISDVNENLKVEIDLQDYLKVLSDEISPICKRLNIALKITNVKTLIIALDKTGKKYNDVKLIGFSKELLAGLESFDVEIMKSIILKVSDYIEH